MVETRATLFERLKRGLEEGIEHARGERALRATKVVLPDPPPDYGVEEIRRIRARLHLSQPGFARLLHVSPKTVQSWEQGTRRPSQAAARLIQFIENPALLTTLHDAPAR
jgi:putative transcriptional regulator